MMCVFPSTSQACLATNQDVAGCETLLQTVDSSSTFCNKLRVCYGFNRTNLSRVWRDSRVNFIQSEDSIHGTCINLICCKTGLNLVGKTRNIPNFLRVNLQWLELQLPQRSYLHLKICTFAVHITFILG